MELSNEQLQDIRVACVYYMQRNISIKNPRYHEYKTILEELNKTIRKDDRNN